MITLVQAMNKITILNLNTLCEMTELYFETLSNIISNSPKVKIESIENNVIEIEVKEDEPIEDTQLLIKANVNSKGKKIYHIPGGMFYNQVQAVEYFKSEEEAIQSGYSKSSR
jgi:hypothetical protein